jgi:hypothetical protein
MEYEMDPFPSVAHTPAPSARHLASFRGYSVDHAMSNQSSPTQDSGRR